MLSTTSSTGYAYVYAAHLGRHDERILSSVETSIGIYGLNGRINRLSGFLTLDGVIREEKKRKPGTIVVVGDDATFLEIAYRLIESKIVLGYIPLAESALSTLLDVPSADAAVATLAARMVETVDMGRVNAKYFFDSLAIDTPASIVCEMDKVLISVASPSMFEISNFTDHPNDGKFTLFITGAQRLWKEPEVSRLAFKRGIIETRPRIKGIIDGHTTVESPFEIELIPKALRIIVGKGKMWYST